MNNVKSFDVLVISLTFYIIILKVQQNEIF